MQISRQNDLAIMQISSCDDLSLTTMPIVVAVVSLFQAFGDLAPCLLPSIRGRVASLPEEVPVTNGT
jgi:hypothetical protein